MTFILFRQTYNDINCIVIYDILYYYNFANSCTFMKTSSETSNQKSGNLLP